MVSLRALTVVAVLSAAAATSAYPGSPRIAVEDARTRATAPGQAVAGGFMTLVNTGTTADRLLRVSSDAAREVQMHESRVEGGVMRMRPIIDGVTVPAGGRVEFKPRGLHLMLVDLKAPLVAGTRVPVTLEFAHAGRITASFRVEALAVPAPETAR